MKGNNTIIILVLVILLIGTLFGIFWFVVGKDLFLPVGDGTGRVRRVSCDVDVGAIAKFPIGINLDMKDALCSEVTSCAGEGFGLFDFLSEEGTIVMYDTKNQLLVKEKIKFPRISTIWTERTFTLCGKTRGDQVVLKLFDSDEGLREERTINII